MIPCCKSNNCKKHQCTGPSAYGENSCRKGTQQKQNGFLLQNQQLQNQQWPIAHGESACKKKATQKQDRPLLQKQQLQKTQMHWLKCLWGKHMQKKDGPKTKCFPIAEPTVAKSPMHWPSATPNPNMVSFCKSNNCKHNNALAQSLLGNTRTEKVRTTKNMVSSCRMTNCKKNSHLFANATPCSNLPRTKS